MRWGAFFYPHAVTIRPLLASGGMGELFGDPYSSVAEVKDEVQLVTGVDGSETISSAQVTIPLPASVPPRSLVTVWPDTANARESSVIRVARAENGGPLDNYLILYLE